MSATFVEPPRDGTSYYALRRRPNPAADAWWAAARRRRDAPPAIAALLAGRTRVELSRDEASQALAWAGGLEGWASLEPKPLHVHPHDPR